LAPFPEKDASMKYMALIYGPPMPPDFSPPPDFMKVWMDYTRAVEEAGVCIGSNQLDDPTTATTITVRDGKRVVTDGPFAETKEILGGYYLFECANLDEALEWAAKCPAAYMGGKLEVRPVIER
jgi:hypothetical protein